MWDLPRRIQTPRVACSIRCEDAVAGSSAVFNAARQARHTQEERRDLPLLVFFRKLLKGHGQCDTQPESESALHDSLPYGLYLGNSLPTLSRSMARSSSALNTPHSCNPRTLFSIE